MLILQENAPDVTLTWHEGVANFYFRGADEQVSTPTPLLADARNLLQVFQRQLAHAHRAGRLSMLAEVARIAP